MACIEIKHVSHSFGAEDALCDVSLRVEDGEFFSLLGPSGCGKTTLLNILGGFLTQTSGEVLIGGRNIDSLPPYKRNIGMVFQHYALFPHLTVGQNVAYGLKNQKKSNSDIELKVKEILNLVRLTDFEKRMPRQLSGGQQQRVAIARALVVQPEILTLDEPLGNLDAQLRKEMQIELRQMQKRVGITTVMVTHDQEEAMSLSDRIAIMNGGRIVQIGAPLEIYRRPINRFVAEFLGKANLIGAVRETDGAFACLEWFQDKGRPVIFKPSREINGDRVLLMLRPERIRISEKETETGINAAVVFVKNITHVGSAVYVDVEFSGGGSASLNVPDTAWLRPVETGERIVVEWSPGDIVPVEEETGKARV
jgi:putative spermidine/putrescine transport system ATP-binding protein